MKENLTISMPKETVEKLRRIKEETGTPVSKILLKSFEKSAYNETTKKS